ncbi:MAG: GNAT family N-acetyltransferase [Candidatus Nanopelagicales bacterium]
MRYDLLGPAAQDAVRRVYEAVFPLALRAPWPDLVGGHPREELLVLLDEHPVEGYRDPIGLALVRHLGQTTMTFLRYFAIDSARHSRGHGSALWRALTHHLRDAGRTLLLFDVEDPAAAAPGHHREDERRIAFYRRHGAELAPVTGYAPPDHGSAGTEPALLLMTADLVRPGRAVEGTSLAAAVVAVYEHRYGLRPDHPTVVATLERSGLSG